MLFKAKQLYQDCVKAFYKKSKQGLIQTQNVIVKYKVQELGNKFLVEIINAASFFYIKKNIFIIEKSRTKQQFLNDLQKQLMKDAQRCFEQIGPKLFARLTFKLNQNKNFIIKMPSSPKKDQILKKHKTIKQIKSIQVYDEQQCKICMNKRSEMVCIPCFHMCVCQKCSQGLKGKCPICRNNGQFKKVFRS